jgi:CRISPR/Cas system-associated exonuclease Cas4 (RecB family)
MNSLFFISLALLFCAVLLLLLIRLLQKRMGSLNEKIFYQDSSITHADVLYANSLPLKGKPDAIIKISGSLIPVEIKTGRTPTRPRPNHVMQLMSYCYLIEEVYNVKPTCGILRYSQTGTEFEIPYTANAKETIESLVAEVLKAKKTGEVFTCTHPDHNR